MVYSCAAYNCMNRRKKDSNVSFHKFPLEKPEVLSKWLAAVKRDKFEPSIHHRLCSLHFTETCFWKTSGKRLLKDDAVPSVFNFSPHLTKLQVTSSSKHALRGDESLEHSYCMEPNCELEDREELAALPVQSTSPNRKRMREDSFTEDGNSREISDSSETPVDNTSVMASFFDYLLAECSQIEDPDVLNNLKTNLFYVVMESVKLDISKRTPSSPSF